MVELFVWVVIVVGIDGIFLEIYFEFDKLFSDGFNMVFLD